MSDKGTRNGGFISKEKFVKACYGIFEPDIEASKMNYYNKEWQIYTQHMRGNKHIYLYFIIDAYFKDSNSILKDMGHVPYSIMRNYIIYMPIKKELLWDLCNYIWKDEQVKYHKGFIKPHSWGFDQNNNGVRSCPEIEGILRKYRNGEYNIKEVAKIAGTPGITEDMTKRQHAMHRSNVLQLLEESNG